MYLAFPSVGPQPLVYALMQLVQAQGSGGFLNGSQVPMVSVPHGHTWYLCPRHVKTLGYISGSFKLHTWTLGCTGVPQTLASSIFKNYFCLKKKIKCTIRYLTCHILTHQDTNKLTCVSGFFKNLGLCTPAHARSCLNVPFKCTGWLRPCQVRLTHVCSEDVLSQCVVICTVTSKEMTRHGITAQCK